METDRLYIERKLIVNTRQSSIFKCKYKPTGELFALKITEPDDEINPHNSTNELRFLKHIKHEDSYEQNNLLHLIDSFRKFEELVMVFDFYQYTLQDLISINVSKRSVFSPNGDIKYKLTNKFDLDRIRSILVDVLTGLKFLHAHDIIHRDVKPSNIFFRDGDPGCRAILGDFGISWFGPNNHGLEEPENKIIDICTGIYKPPELIFGLKSYTNKVDIWCVGIMLMVLYDDQRGNLLLEAEPSDLSLLNGILDVFGSPGNWPEMQNNEVFSNMNITKRARRDVILSRCLDSQIQHAFDQMMVFESGERWSCDQLLEFLLRK